MVLFSFCGIQDSLLDTLSANSRKTLADSSYMRQFTAYSFHESAHANSLRVSFRDCFELVRFELLYCSDIKITCLRSLVQQLSIEAHATFVLVTSFWSILQTSCCYYT